MFNIEGPEFPSAPFPTCPKMKEKIEQERKEITQNLATNHLCLHAKGCNASLGPYIRCIECGQESMLRL